MSTNGRDIREFFEAGVLLGLQIRTWSGERKIKETQVRAGTADPQWLKGIKALVDREALAEIKKAASDARNFIYSVALPFPVWGLNFVPRDLVDYVNRHLTDYKGRFDAGVERFLRNWEAYLIQARVRLGNLFREEDYPEAPEGKFSFWWQFLELTGPDNSLRAVSPAIYEQEMGKFRQSLEEAREAIIWALREEFAQMVRHLVEKLRDPRARFKDSTVTKFQEWLALFDRRNAFGDQELAQWAEKAKQVLAGVSPDVLRENEDFRKEVANAFRPVHEFVEQNITRIRRKIRVPGREGAGASYPVGRELDSALVDA